MISALHAQRLDAVTAALAETGARTVLDLGCGDGALLLRLAAMPAIRRICGLDAAAARLGELRTALATEPAEARAKVELIEASLTDRAVMPVGFDAAVLIETLEHVAPERLSAVEHAVFRVATPATVIVTTPNAEFNELLGVPPHRLRHPEHRFEWGRARFGRWAEGVAARHGYGVARRDVGVAHPTLGSATQMAVFQRPTSGGGRRSPSAAP